CGLSRVRSEDVVSSALLLFLPSDNLQAPITLSFFFQAEDGIRDRNVTGVQTCALPILFFRHPCFSFELYDTSRFLCSRYFSICLCTNNRLYVLRVTTKEVGR